MRRPTVAAGITILGGAAMAIGTFLSFAEFHGGRSAISSQSFRLLDVSDGKWFLSVGIVLLVAGVVLWVATSERLLRGAAIVAFLGGGMMLYGAINDIVGIEDDILQAYAERAAELSGSSADQVRAFLETLDVSAQPGIGLYVVLAAAALGVAGGLLGLLAKRPAELPAAPPPPESDSA